MNESAVYNETDLASFHKRLSELRQIVHQDSGQVKHPKALTKLLERQLSECGTPPSLSCLRLVKPSKLLCRGDSHTDARILGRSITRTCTCTPEIGHYSSAARHTGRQGEISKVRIETTSGGIAQNWFVEYFSRFTMFVAVVCLRSMASLLYGSLTFCFFFFFPSYFNSRAYSNARIPATERVWMANSLPLVELSLLLRPFVLRFWKNALKLLKKSKHMRTRSKSRHLWSPFTTV